jgi:hypothetical protein
MEFVDLIIGGTGIVKGILLLLGLGMDEKSLGAEIKRYYDELMKMKGAPQTNGKVDELIALIIDDKFDDPKKPKTFNVFQRPENWGYLATLKNLKEKIVKFYFTSLEELKNENGKFTDVRDVQLRISDYLLQLMRLRMVIKPDYKVSRNKHPQTDHTYYAVKAYWIDDEGKKVRQFARSMGREETYKGGIKGEQAQLEGLNVIQPVMYDYYKNIYPD